MLVWSFVVAKGLVIFVEFYWALYNNWNCNILNAMENRMILFQFLFNIDDRCVGIIVSFQFFHAFPKYHWKTTSFEIIKLNGLIEWTKTDIYYRVRKKKKECVNNVLVTTILLLPCDWNYWSWDFRLLRAFQSQSQWTPDIEIWLRNSTHLCPVVVNNRITWCKLIQVPKFTSTVEQADGIVDCMKILFSTILRRPNFIFPIRYIFQVRFVDMMWASFGFKLS